MTNKPAVSQAQIKRAILAAEALGKTVSGIDLLPDGTVRVTVGPVAMAAVAEANDPGSSWASFDKAHGFG